MQADTFIVGIQDRACKGTYCLLPCQYIDYIHALDFPNVEFPT